MGLRPCLTPGRHPADRHVIAHGSHYVAKKASLIPVPAQQRLKLLSLPALARSSRSAAPTAGGSTCRFWAAACPHSSGHLLCQYVALQRHRRLHGRGSSRSSLRHPVGRQRTHPPVAGPGHRPPPHAHHAVIHGCSTDSSSRRCHRCCGWSPRVSRICLHRSLRGTARPVPADVTLYLRPAAASQSAGGPWPLAEASWRASPGRVGRWAKGEPLQDVQISARGSTLGVAFQPGSRREHRLTLDLLLSEPFQSGH